MSDQPPRRGLHLKEITNEGTTDTLGGILRQARAAKGEDLKAASRSTKIRPEYLEALEDGKIDLLPGRAYAIGFLRAYAAFLGLDPAECIARFKTENAPAAASTEPTLGFDEKSQPASGPQVSHTVLLLLGVVLFGLIYGGIYLFRSANETIDRRAKAPSSIGASHRPTPLGPAASLSPHDATGTQVGAASAPAPGSADASAPTPTAPAAAKTSTEDNTDVTPPADDAETTPEAPTPKAADAQAKAQASAAPAPQATADDTSFDKVAAAAPHSYGVASAPGRIVLRATEKVFVRIAQQGTRQQVVYQGGLAKGDLFYVPALDGIVLTTRNGGAIDVYVDKALKGAAGPKGIALSGLPLDPNSFGH